MSNQYYVAGIPFSDELYHHGIKGQKWGVRRFENYDGTLTQEGKIRYRKSSALKGNVAKCFDNNGQLSNYGKELIKKYDSEYYHQLFDLDNIEYENKMMNRFSEIAQHIGGDRQVYNEWSSVLEDEYNRDYNMASKSERTKLKNYEKQINKSFEEHSKVQDRFNKTEENPSSERKFKDLIREQIAYERKVYDRLKVKKLMDIVSRISDPEDQEFVFCYLGSWWYW